jgi:hypothetical protein
MSLTFTTQMKSEVDAESMRPNGFAPAMTRLLLLSYTFPPDKTPAAVRPGQLFRYLPEFGYQPLAVACANPESPTGDSFVYRTPSEVVRPAVKLASAFARSFERYAGPYNDRLPWAPHAVATALALLKKEKVEAIYSTSPFLAAHFAALWLKKRTNLPWIADFQDPVCDNPTRTRRWIYPYDPLFERAVFQNATSIVANTDTVAAEWRKRFPREAGKISVLWNSFDPVEEIQARQAPARPHRVMAHVGDLYGDRRLGQLFSAVNTLIGNHQLDALGLRIRLVGAVFPEVLAEEGPLFEQMRQARILDYDGLRLPRNQALAVAAEADYLLVIDQPVTSLQVPSKLIDYIRIGKPILAFTPPGSPVERILAQSGIPHQTIAPRASNAVTSGKLAEFLQLTGVPRKADPWFHENFNCVSQARLVAGLLDRARRGEDATINR